MRHMVLELNVDLTTSDFSVEGLRGSAKTSNHRLVDSYSFEAGALGHLCHKLPIQLGIEGDTNSIGFRTSARVSMITLHTWSPNLDKISLGAIA
jgi:hypothetical protein